MKLPDHLFVAGGGELYDCRVLRWNAKPPLRENYRHTHRNIATVADLKATLRAGSHAWPGGYPLYFVTSDGGVLSFETVRNEFENVRWSIKNKCGDGWLVVGCDVNWEDSELTDDHTGDKIESAYGD
jgi:hypothetical protein